jgi:hypothetical protein
MKGKGWLAELMIVRVWRDSAGVLSRVYCPRVLRCEWTNLPEIPFLWVISWDQSRIPWVDGR